jgi:hypothetical protein
MKPATPMSTKSSPKSAPQPPAPLTASAANIGKSTAA